MKDKRGEISTQREKIMIMKRGIRGVVMAIVIAVAMLGVSNKAMAQCSCEIHNVPHNYEVESQRRNIYTEWGVGIGATYTGIGSMSTTEVSLAPRYGFQGHFDIAVCFGEHFAIETEIIYEGGSIDAKWRDLERRIRTRNVDIPVLLSARFWNNRLRLSAGPQFAVKSSGEYSVDGDTYFYGPVTPTWNIAAGVCVRISKHLIIEARYICPLVDSVNQFGAKQNEADSGVEFTTRCYKIAAGVTLLF